MIRFQRPGHPVVLFRSRLFHFTLIACMGAVLRRELRRRDPLRPVRSDRSDAPSAPRSDMGYLVEARWLPPPGARRERRRDLECDVLDGGAQTSSSLALPRRTVARLHRGKPPGRRPRSDRTLERTCGRLRPRSRPHAVGSEGRFSAQVFPTSHQGYTGRAKSRIRMPSVSDDGSYVAAVHLSDPLIFIYGTATGAILHAVPVPSVPRPSPQFAPVPRSNPTIQESFSAVAFSPVS